jgi:dipeptidyl aminopeptidase/acylaminoacyl peptidase
MNAPIVLYLVLGCLLCLSSAALADHQADRGFTLQDGLSLHQFTRTVPVDLSTDGHWVAYSTQNYSQQEGISRPYSKTGVPRDELHSAVWVTEAATGSTRRLTPPGSSGWAPRWSPDGRRLAFYSDQQGKLYLFVWDRQTDQFQVFRAAVARPWLPFEIPQWSPDGHSVFFKALPQGAALSLAEPGTREPAARREEPMVEVWRSPAPKISTDGEIKRPDQPPPPPGPTQKIDLAVAAIDIGQVYRLMRGYSIRSFFIAPDGKHVAVVGNIRPEKMGSQQVVFDLWVVPIPFLSRLSKLAPSTTRAWKPLLTGLRMAWGICVSWSPDSTRLAYTTNGPLATGDLVVVNTKDGVSHNLTEEVPAEAGGKPRRVKVDGAELPRMGSEYCPPLWTRDGSELLCLSEEDLWTFPSSGGPPWNLTNDLHAKVVSVVRPSEGYTAWTLKGKSEALVVTVDPERNVSGFCRVNLTNGECVQLFEEEKAYQWATRFILDVAEQTGAVIFAAETATIPADIWLLDPSTAARRPVTRINPHLLSVALGTPRVIQWQTAAGRIDKGILILPPSASAQHKAPLIARIYAGRPWAPFLRFFGAGNDPATEHPALFVARGYAVLLPDMPLTSNEPAAEITQTTLAAVDAAIATGVIDGDRLGVFGHSFGGYTVNALITQTARFKAAVSSAGIADLISLYLSGQGGRDWVEGGLPHMGGTIWEHTDRYIRNSPVFHLHQIATPVMLVVGEKDDGISPAQSREMYNGLERLGKEVVLLEYKNGGHHWSEWSEKQMTDFWQRVLDWFDDHLKAKSSQVTQAH